MLATKRHSGFIQWKPRGFVALMSLYESNYLRLRRLLAEAAPRPGASLVSRVAGDPPLQLDGLERGPYTLTLRMTYLFDDGTDPDLVIRVYEDAHLAEAMACSDAQRHPLFSEFATGAGSQLERRWARNLMLNKWLAHCHDRGHAFGLLRCRVEEPIHAGLR